jgi:putative FmdB family regulatory protein
MPIYEYRCRKGHTFEVRQSFSDGPVAKCEVCGAPVARVFRPVAVHFKGSGFYNTDYGTRKRSREMKEAKEGAKTDGAKSDGAKAEGAKAEGANNSSSNSSSDSGSGSSSESGGAKSDAPAKKSESKTA